MREYIEKVMNVMKFEVEVMERLKGKKEKYVGNRMKSNEKIMKESE